MTVQQLYEEALRTLTRSGRLELAHRLLGSALEEEINTGDEWTDTDLRQFTFASMRTVDEQLRSEGDAGLG